MGGRKMGIQSLTISGADRDPTKPKALSNQEPKTSVTVERKEESQQSEDFSGSKAFADEISNSAGVDMSMSRLSFSKDEETGDIVIKIIDNKTDEVIKQIPPKEFEELKKRLGDILGLVLDKKA
jgi:flagellar protein FlaG